MSIYSFYLDSGLCSISTRALHSKPTARGLTLGHCRVSVMAEWFSKQASNLSSQHIDRLTSESERLVNINLTTHGNMGGDEWPGIIPTLYPNCTRMKRLKLPESAVLLSQTSQHELG